MKRNIILLVATLLASVLRADDYTSVEAILRQVEQHNTQLKAARQQDKATLAELRSDNTLGETSVEYSPFYQSGVSRTSSSELIVSQEFDFPTVYAQRRKGIALQQNVLEQQYRILRRDVLFQTEQLCLDLNSCYQLSDLYQARLALSDSLLRVFDLRLQQGDATILDVNRIKLERMALQKECVRNEGEVQSLLLQLNTLNGGQDLSPDLLQALRVPVVMSADSLLLMADGNSRLEVSAAEASLSASEHDVRLSRQGWVPKLTLGYRRNTELREASNGVLVGVSVPLFGTSAKIKAAQMRQEAAQQELEHVRREAEGRQRSLVAEAQMLGQLLQTGDADLMQQNLGILWRAVLAGELSIADYYTEADRAYEMLQELILTRLQYNKLLAELRQNAL